MKIWLMGDSIRLGYQPLVTQMLPEHEIVGIPDNGRFVRFTMYNLEGWIKEIGPVDIIHWNNGLWDISLDHPLPECFTPVEEYVRDMGIVFDRLKKTGAKVIFATTTPVRQPNTFRRLADVQRYNEHVLPHLRSRGAVVNDLFSVVLPHLDEYVCDDYVHMTDSGNAACAQAVVDALRLQEA